MTTTERTLILLRHAKSDWSDSLSDIDRPLAERGRAQAPLAGTWLARHAGRIDLAIVSPARRTRETWALVQAELGGAPRTIFEDRMYLASADRLLEIVRGAPDSARTVLLVGHNSGLEELASLAAGEDVIMRTSGIAVIDVRGSWRGFDAESATLRIAGRLHG